MVEPASSHSVEERVRQLLAAVEGGTRALICTHDNPDPDSIASAFALGRLLEQKRDIPFTLTYGGVLGRAENRAMVRLLKIPLVPISRIQLDEFDVVGLVDTQLDVGNHSLDAARMEGKRVICIDHHPARLLFKNAAYADVGGDYGATSSALTAYCYAAGVVFDEVLASALFYGIKTDTRDLGRQSSQADVWAYSHLVGLTDMALVSAIEHPRLPRSYFSVLVRAVQHAQVWGNVVACDLGETYIPDIVAETADRLVAAEGMRWAIIVGEYDGQVYASIRVNDRRYSAGKLVREVIQRYPEGSAGGHASMAGARLPHGPRQKTRSARTRVRRQLLRDLVLATGIGPETQAEPFAREAEALEATAERAKPVSPVRNGSGPAKRPRDLSGEAAPKTE